MSTKTAQDHTPPAQTSQTPFERFKDALSHVMAVPKSALPKPSKKSRKK